MSSIAASARGSCFCPSQKAAFFRTLGSRCDFISSMSIGTDSSFGSCDTAKTALSRTPESGSSSSEARMAPAALFPAFCDSQKIA